MQCSLICFLFTGSTSQQADGRGHSQILHNLAEGNIFLFILNFFLLLSIINHILYQLFNAILLDQDNMMDTSEQQDHAVDGASVHQQDTDTQANNIQDGGGAMNGICLLAYLHQQLFYTLIILLFRYLFRANLLAIYLDTRECWRCHERFPVIDFVSSTTCRACSRRHRSALNNSMHEVSLSTEPVSHSYDEFVSTHLTDIEDVLREAIATHK